MNQNHTAFGKRILPKCLFAITIMLFAALFIAPIAAEESMTVDKEEILLGEIVTVSLIGVPNSQITLTYETVLLENEGNDGKATVTLDGDGKGTAIFKGIDLGRASISFIASDGKLNMLSIQIKDGYITLTQTPTIVKAGETYTISGTAPLAEKIRYYIFGNAYFKQGETTVSGNTFTISGTAPNTNEEIYVIIQHPLSDNVFNITVEKQSDEDSLWYDIYRYYGKDWSEDVGSLYTGAQGENMAESFCNTFEQYSYGHDKCVKLSFEVKDINPNTVITPTQTEIESGEKLHVSGNIGIAESKEITVEMLSPSYIGFPRDSLGTNRFVIYYITTNEDGSWSVDIDTSGLQRDEYIILVTVDSVSYQSESIRVTSPSTPSTDEATNTFPSQGVYRNIIVNPATSLISGQEVTGSLTMHLNDVRDYAKLSFGSGLEDMEWTIKVFDEYMDKDAQNPIITFSGVSQPNSPYEPPTYSMTTQNSVTLVISFSGKVPEIEFSAIRVLDIRPNFIESYQSPSQKVYNTEYVNYWLTQLDSTIQRTENRITEYTACSDEYNYNIDFTDATNYLDSAKVKAEEAKQETEKTVILQKIEEAEIYLSKADDSLYRNGGNIAYRNINQIDSAISQLYNRGWKTEGVYLETRVTPLKQTVSFVQSYTPGSVTISPRDLDSLVFDSASLLEEANSYLGGNTLSSLPTTLTLRPGWNVISTPKHLDETCSTAEKLFSGINSGGISPMGYDAETGKWYVLEADTPIQPLNSYWIYTTEPLTITLTYSTALITPPTKNVYPGWNAIGLCAEHSLSAEETFNNIAWVEYLAWDISSGKWNTVIANGISDDKIVMPTNGGWLYVEENGIYTGKTA